jgi:hypothetical protein
MQRKRQESMQATRNVNFNAAELNDQADCHISYLRQLHMQIKAFTFGGKLVRFVECGDGDDWSVGSLEILKLKVPTVVQSYFKNDSSTLSS